VCPSPGGHACHEHVVLTRSKNFSRSRSTTHRYPPPCGRVPAGRPRGHSGPAGTRSSSGENVGSMRGCRTWSKACWISGPAPSGYRGSASLAIRLRDLDRELTGADSGRPAAPPGSAPSGPAVRQQSWTVIAVHPVPLGSQDARVCGHEVLAAQHLLHEPRSLVPGTLLGMRTRLTLGAWSLGGAPPAPRAARALSLVPASPSRRERLTPVRLLVFGLRRDALRLLRPRLTPGLLDPFTAGLACASLQVSQGKTLMSPIYPRIYAGRPGDIGLQVVWPPRHLTDASYAVRVPRARALPAASFPRRLATTQLPFS